MGVYCICIVTKVRKCQLSIANLVLVVSALRRYAIAHKEHSELATSHTQFDQTPVEKESIPTSSRTLEVSQRLPYLVTVVDVCYTVLTQPLQQRDVFGQTSQHERCEPKLCPQ